MVDRPRTVNGATSFHFSYIPISKEALPTVNGAPVEGSFGKVKSAALEHSKYIERDGAAERSAGAQHAGYIERRSEEHTSELQSLMRISYAVFCLKKKLKTTTRNVYYHVYR